MALGLRQRAAFDELEAAWRERAADTPSLVPVSPDIDGESPQVPCPEIDCLRGLLPRATLEKAAQRAAEIGVGADRVLVCSGALDEEIYLRALCDHHQFVFEPLDDKPRELCVQPDERLCEAMQTGMVQLRIGDELVIVIAPQRTAVRGVLELITTLPDLTPSFRFTTAERMRRFILKHAVETIGTHAAHALQQASPALSAAPPRWRHSLAPAIVTGIPALAALIIAPGPVTVAFEIVLALIFLAWMILRMAGTLVGWPVNAAPVRIPDDKLPVYTIMVALCREAAAVEDLISALQRLDYPIEKLDIKLIVEPDDLETQAAIARLRLGAPFETIVAPDVGPRTKPKALNAGLPFARGTFTVIYDAEDRPEPDQLRRALDVFTSHDDTLACVQACLTIDNTADNWLTSLFTAEYAGQFDVFLPALASLRLPLPLGGSSNHFCTAQLREVGAWDPYNVTEDADLGLRLARFGYRASVTRSATYEEAPARLGPWLKQRTRWFKGWMQTWLVHMREPRRLLRELGLPGFLTFQLMVGGNVLAALVHPLFILWFATTLMGPGPVWETQGTAVFYGFTVLFGYFASAVLGAVGLFRRDMLSIAWVLLLMPLHWLLLAAAAWRALYQLIRDPYRWEKTEHGLARTSRMAATHPPDEPFANLVPYAAAGRPRGPTDISAIPRPLPRAFASS